MKLVPTSKDVSFPASQEPQPTDAKFYQTTPIPQLKTTSR